MKSTETGSETAPPRASEEVREEFERLFYSSVGQTWGGVRWLGVRAFKLPLDLWVMQEIVAETRPELIIETGVAEGERRSSTRTSWTCWVEMAASSASTSTSRRSTSAPAATRG